MSNSVDLHVRIDPDQIADLRAVCRMPTAAIARAGLAKLAAMVVEGQPADLRILVAEHVQPTGPKPAANLNQPNNQ